jgi:membrane-bound metal-dependent hydrolase YbcI (DUF457 family)
MNYIEHLITGTGSLCGLLLIADRTGFAPVPDPVTLAAGLGMAALGSIAVDIDHPRSFISFTAPIWVFKLGVQALIFFSIPVIITIASSRQVNLMEPGQLLRWDVFGLLIAVVVGSSVLFLVSRLVHGFFKHRGPIHSPTFLVGITLFVTILLALFVRHWWWMGLLFSWGWFSHIAADGLTPKGIPLLWPLTSQRYNLLPGCLLAPAHIFVVVICAGSVVLLFARLLKIY